MDNADKARLLLPSNLIRRINDWIWSPVVQEESRLTDSLRGFLRIVWIFCREFNRDNIPLRSSALTFTIVLSLVPTLALGTAVLKGLGAGDQMRQTAYRFIEQMESPQAPAQEEGSQGSTREMIDQEAQVSVQDTGQQDENAPDQETGTESGQQLSGHLRKAADQIFDYVDKTDFAKLGAFGVIGLVWAVLSVLGSIEKAMNRIWQVESDRPFGRKLMDYLALMILLPLSVNLALATEATLNNQTLIDKVHEVLPVVWLTHLLLTLLPALMVLLTFTVLYRFLPNTKVRMLPAMAGGAMGGISWFLIQSLYVKLQIGVAKYNAIYGSFATLPLFLLWLYIGWIIFLAGSEMSFACQVWKHYQWKRAKLTPVRRLALSFSLLESICLDFKNRTTSTVASLVADHPQENIDEIRICLAELTKGGYLKQIQDEIIGYFPATPVEEMSPSEIVELVFGNEVTPGHPLAVQALQAASGSVAQNNLVPGK